MLRGNKSYPWMEMYYNCTSVQLMFVRLILSRCGTGGQVQQGCAGLKLFWDKR